MSSNNDVILVPVSRKTIDEISVTGVIDNYFTETMKNLSMLLRQWIIIAINEPKSQ